MYLVCFEDMYTCGRLTVGWRPWKELRHRCKQAQNMDGREMKHKWHKEILRFPLDKVAGDWIEPPRKSMNEVELARIIKRGLGLIISRKFESGAFGRVKCASV